MRKELEVDLISTESETCIVKKTMTNPMTLRGLPFPLIDEELKLYEQDVKIHEPSAIFVQVDPMHILYKSR